LSGRFRFLFGASIALVLLALLERGLEPFRARDAMSPAQWVWAPGEWRNPRPVAFFAAADFYLADDGQPVLLSVAGDEEFVASVNGKVVARGFFEDDVAVRAVDLAEVVRPGGNRVVIEARSARGAGGLRALIRQGDRVVAASDRTWRVFRRLEPGLQRGWLPLAGGEPVLVWGAPPVGRWGQQRLAAEIERAASELPVEPTSVMRGRSLAPRTPWRRDWPSEAITPALRGASLVDFGRPVEGYLGLRYVGEGEALLFVGLERPPDPRAARPDHVVVRVSASAAWADATPRRVRYVLSVGDARLVGAWMDPAPVGAVTAPRAPRPGVLGVVPPVLRSPVEDKLRREFEGFTRLDGGEEG
jgi:hypothetical protein